MDKTFLQNCIDRNLSQREIASECGKSQSTIKHWLKKHGIKTNKHVGNKKYGYLCEDCGETKKSKFVSVGDGRLSHVLCKRCHSRRSVARFRKHKQRAVDYKGGKCQVCGYNKSLRSLDFHHRDPGEKDVKFNSNWVKQWNFERVKKELDKCDLLCRNCHGEAHDAMDAIKLGP